jgi:hypothetical protein
LGVDKQATPEMHSALYVVSVDSLKVFVNSNPLIVVVNFCKIVLPQEIRYSLHLTVA